ncbi:MAG: GAF domain-containing protein [Thermoplasmata archaeon]|jgi:PAS domain S-box-containing protein|nr:GAF domain-containing protein [Thermoplasmata archaeon]
MSTPVKIDAESLVASLQDGVVVCSKSGEILYANQHFARMMGVLKDQIMAKNMGKDLVDRELEWRALVSLLEQGSPIADYEMRFRRADGVKLCITISATNLRDEKGVLTGLGIVARDISTRKGVEDELRDKAFRTDIMNKVAKLTGTTIDVKHVILPVSEELRKLINFDLLCISVTEEKGRHVEVLVPDRKNPESAKVLGKVPFEGSIVEKLKYGRNALIIEKEAGRKLFSELTLLEQESISSFVAVPLMSRGRVLGSLSIAHSKQGEYNWESAEALQMVADQLAGLVDNMILMSSLEKKVKLGEVLVKSGVELQKAITTQQVYQAISAHMGEVVPYKDLSFYLVDWQKGLVFPVHAVGTYTDEVMATAGPIDEGIVGVVAKSGKAEFVDDVDADPRGADVPGTPYEHNAMLAIPLVGSDGVLGVLELYRERGLVFTNSDLEAGTLFAQQAAVALQTFQLITKLQDAKKEIEMLNDLMFHDINNYNFATLNYIENIWKAPDVAANHKVFLEKSLHLIRQNAKLIENVRKLTKIGVVRPEDLVPVDLTDVLRKVSAGIQTSTPDKRVSIRLNMPESGHAVVHANPLVEELFVNLLGNAVKYDPHEEVEVDVDGAKVLEDGKICWKVCVSDHGNGIPDDKKAKLFQKYVRLKPDSKIAGTGLGLSICKALADKFGGRIWVEDRVAGKSELGAKFCIVFPAVKREEKA